MATAILLQNVSGFLLQNVQVSSQNATIIKNCDDFITKYDSYYKMRRLLQIATVQMYTFISNNMLMKLAKIQAKGEQHSDPELSLLENYLLSSYMFSSKKIIITDILENVQKANYMIHMIHMKLYGSLQ